MILVIGGSNQGKLHWALREFDCRPEQVLDGGSLAIIPGQSWPLGEYRVLNHLESLLQNVLQQNFSADDMAALQNFLLKLPEDFVVICNSVGGGLVPLERFEREWRELVGRTCCALAAEAGQVWRIFCGLPQRLK